MTYIRKDGQPHGGGGTQSIYKRNDLSPGSVKSTNPAADLKEMLAKRPDFDPKNPASMFHNVGRKFTAQLKLEFLEHLAEWGRIGMAAHSVGVTQACVLDHRKTDPRFDELCVEAMTYHREQTISVMVRQAIEGHPEYKYDKEGNLLSARRMFEPALRLAVLKYYEPGFIETQKQELTVQGGAIMVPAPTADVSNWASVVASLENGASAPPSAPTLPAGATGPVEGKTLPRADSEPLESLSGIAEDIAKDGSAIVVNGTDATADGPEE